MKRNLYIGSTLLALMVALGIGQGLLEKKTEAQAKGNNVMVPRDDSRFYGGHAFCIGNDAFVVDI